MKSVPMLRRLEIARISFTLGSPIAVRGLKHPRGGGSAIKKEGSKTAFHSRSFLLAAPPQELTHKVQRHWSGSAGASRACPCPEGRALLPVKTARCRCEAELIAAHFRAPHPEVLTGGPHKSPGLINLNVRIAV